MRRSEGQNNNMKIDDLAPNPEDGLLIELAKIKARLERKLEDECKINMRLQVNTKGALSLYGIRRSPITLYAEEWQRLLMLESEIKTFIVAHKSELTFTKRKQRSIY